MSTLTIAAVQFDIDWLDQEANLAHLRRMIAEHFKNHKAVDLLLLPETFATGFCTSDPAVREPADGGEILFFLKDMAQQFNCVVAGSVFVAQGDKKANRFYWVWPDGSTEYYDKRHLFRLGSEGEFVAQGKQRKLFEINGIRILPQVCYDLRFPVWSRNRQDYDLLVNVANWPAARRLAWDSLLKARAIENQVYVVAVNRVGADRNGVAHSGGSCVLNFLGETVVAAQDHEQQIISWTLDFSELKRFKQDFPFYLDADDYELKS